jgi:DNA-binding XRE family transcriptional regulator
VNNKEAVNMKKSIFDKKMENPKFKAVYDEVSTEMNIGEQIAQIRHKAKMSQLELARKVDTSRTAIARYESGNYNKYNVSTLMRIGKALHKKLKVCYV